MNLYVILNNIISAVHDFGQFLKHPYGSLGFITTNTFIVCACGIGRVNLSTFSKRSMTLVSSPHAYIICMHGSLGYVTTNAYICVCSIGKVNLSLHSLHNP